MQRLLLRLLRSRMCLAAIRSFAPPENELVRLNLMLAKHNILWNSKSSAIVWMRLERIPIIWIEIRITSLAICVPG